MRTAGGSSEPELLFGPLARALAPRAICPLTASARVSLALDAAGLSPHARSVLAALPRATLAAGAGARAELVLECEHEDLERCAGTLEEAALLLAAWEAATRTVLAPSFMGVVNVTPDSFSDGGRYLDPERAIVHGLQLEAEGAAILDVGGESTRPGAQPVPAEEELARVLPVVAGLAARSMARVSIDTSKAAVARAAVAGGARIVNDVSAGRADPDLLATVAELGCELYLMHSRGTPSEMQRDPRYVDPVAEVTEELRAQVAECLKAGIALRRMTVDPGIGFGKRLEHNLDLLRRLPELRSLGLPICVGVSRKSFIAHATGRLSPSDWDGNRPHAEGGGANDRSGGTAAAVAACALAGADVLRVHEVARTREAASVALAIGRRPARPPTAAMSELPPTADERGPRTQRVEGH